MKIREYQAIETELRKRFGAANVELELFSDFMGIYVRNKMGIGKHYYPLEGISKDDIIEDVSSCYLMVKGGRYHENIKPI